MFIAKLQKCFRNIIPEDRWSCIAQMSAEDLLRSTVFEEKKFKNIESE